MADAVDPEQRTPPGSTELWFRRRVVTRFAATVWWIAVLAYGLIVVSAVVGLVRHFDPWAAVITAGLALVIGIPIARHLRDAPAMWKMLRHGV
ncbi:hypothetical protein [Aquihabitans sp. McL0605]|uniref:hypothetical protein n=1 Tax=Aquihabitans sp. McL0605 TaxID=3415671 RepID=UPI003CF2FCC9